MNVGINDLFGYMLVFARFIGLLSMMPGFGDSGVSPRIRIIFVMMLSIILTPLVLPRIPLAPEDPIFFGLLLLMELIIGVFAGIIIKVIFAAIDIAGSLIGYQMSLASAFAQGAASFQQSTLPGTFIGLIATLLFFVTDLHHIVFKVLIESYMVFQVDNLQTLKHLSEDFLKMLLTMTTKSLVLGLQLASPLVVMGVLMQFCFGIVNRLMPQIQVFFILQPLQLLLGFIVILYSIAIILKHFMEFFTHNFTNIWLIW